MTKGMKVGRTHQTQEWSPLDLILLRCNLDAGRFRLENRLEEVKQSGETVDDSQLKNTQDLIETLTQAMICLHDLESQRNIANHNSMIERASHIKTMLRLEESQEKIQKLQTEGENLRTSLQRFMR
tara:strand:- start:3773 stop:4150 length:378 start_codon:yes stop_codon:yes gene_type:complete